MRLIDNPNITLQVHNNNLKLTTLLPVKDIGISNNCLEMLEKVYSSRLDSRSKPLENVELKWFIDGRSFI
jgi:hypothetical protein